MEPAFVIRNWKLTLVSGLLALLFGIVILIWPAATTLVLLILFGALALVDGIFHVVQAITDAARKEKWVLTLLFGLLETIVGIIVLSRPGVGLGALLVLVIVYLVAYGFVEIFAAFEMQAVSTGLRVLLGITGVLSVVVGFIFMFRPGLGIWSVILFIGIYSIFVGILRVILAVLIRSWWKEQPPAGAAV
ncbi:MAG: DUF308 domain-containing protein [Actinomycetota bacterium]|nr:DUF308 domain-containing protein [Actinomycetota bacterium]MDD5668026.1 DUF308 domain-containing protein [Actinomycetota bacterium]